MDCGRLRLDQRAQIHAGRVHGLAWPRADRSIEMRALDNMPARRASETDLSGCDQLDDVVLTHVSAAGAVQGWAVAYGPGRSQGRLNTKILA